MDLTAAEVAFVELGVSPKHKLLASPALAVLCLMLLPEKPPLGSLPRAGSPCSCTQKQHSCTGTRSSRPASDLHCISRNIAEQAMRSMMHSPTWEALCMCEHLQLSASGV